MHGKRFGICNNCNENDGKYRCPKCALVSCSLKCCKEHKISNNCNGIKEKIDFMPLSAMNSDVLRKDMSFLMNLSSKIQISHRDPLLHHKQNRDTNNRFRSLCSAAKFKKIRLFLQPIGMAKHQNNKTYITKSPMQNNTNNNNNKNHTNVLKTIHWTISVQFGCHQLLLHNINENETLLSVLRNLKHQKFQTLQADTIVSKIVNQNRIFGAVNNNKNSVEHEIEDKYYRYLDDMNLIRLPVLQKKKRSKHKKYYQNNAMDSHTIARSIIQQNVLPKFWSCVMNNCTNKKMDNKDKLNIILRIPNHFMYIRINPNKAMIHILKQKIINEYPEFIVLTPDEMLKNEYVIMDFMEYHQFENCIKHNTKIQRQREKLKVEMERKLNENKLFQANKNNRYQRKYTSKNNNKKFDQRSNNLKQRNNNNNNNNNNGLKARDLFNGNIMNGNKRYFNEMNQRNNNNYSNNCGGYEPSMKRMRYNQNNNNHNQPKTFINPFNLNNVNDNKQKQPPNNKTNDWYLYL